MDTRLLEFDTRDNTKQKLCATYWADSVTSEIVYGGSKGSAKSFTGCSLIFSDAFTYPNTHYFIARKTGEDLKKFTIPSIHEVFEIWGIDQKYYKFNGQHNYYEAYNGSKVYLLAAKYLPSDKLYQRFGSMQMTRGWIEEAGEFEKSAKDNLKISIGRWKNELYGITGKLLLTCNPAKNFLYSEYYKPYIEGVLPEWRKFIQALPQDNKCLDDGYLENLERTLSDSAKARLLLGDWDYDDNPNALYDYDSILDTYTNDHVTGDQLYMSCDVAMEGSDKLIIGCFKGWHCFEIREFPKTDGKEVLEYLRATKRKYGIKESNIVFDANGVGNYLSGFFKRAKAFRSQAKPLNNENYENLRAQCFYKLKPIINGGLMRITATAKQRELINQELSVIKTRDEDKDGKLKINRKEDIKKLISRSCDYADMVAMRAIFDIGKRKIKRIRKTYLAGKTDL